MNENAVKTVKERDPYFDNYKGFLIICVILCHLLHDPCDYGDSPEIIGHIYTFLLSFVMPAFVFMSGYFSKNVQKSRDGAVKNFLIPFIIFNTLESIFDYMISAPDEPFHDWFRATTPYWAMWYLFAMFIWRMLAPELMKLRYSVLLTLLIGIGSGFVSDISTKFALGRVMSLLFFFTLGLKFRKEWAEAIRKKHFIIGIIILAVFFLLIPVLMDTKIAGYHFLTRGSLLARKPYPENGTLVAMSRRIYFYFAGTAMTLALMMVMPHRKTVITKIGKNSISVYVFHIFALFYFRATDYFEDEFFIDIPGFFCLVALDLVLAFIFSRDSVRAVYDGIVNFVNRLLFKEDTASDIVRKE